MRLGIDACCWSNQRGFGRFTRELVAPLVRLCAGRHDVVLVVDRDTAETGSFPDGAALEIVETSRQPTRAASADSARSPLDLWRMGRGAARARPEVFLFPAVYTFYPIPRRIPTVVTFHDAIAESFPDLIFGNRRARLFWSLKTKMALWHADRVLTVSESARDQFQRVFGYPTERVAVTTEGPGPDFGIVDDPGRIAAVRARYRLPEDRALILYVGGISPHKNLDALVRAVARLPAEGGPAWHLVLVGDYEGDAFYGCYRELSAQIEAAGLGDRATFTGFVPNEDLALLYNAATLLVLPSFSEGFGLPVVEAMVSGLPVAASRAGSLPEVVGDAGLLFDPNDDASIAGSLRALLSDDELRGRLRRDGLERAKLFSWDASARRVLELLEELGGAGGGHA